MPIRNTVPAEKVRGAVIKITAKVLQMMTTE
jgi:hypothetical protein